MSSTPVVNYIGMYAMLFYGKHLCKFFSLKNVLLKCLLPTYLTSEFNNLLITRIIEIHSEGMVV